MTVKITYEALLALIEAGQLADVREAVTRAFDAFFRGEVDHLEEAFAIRSHTTRVHRLAGHRQLTSFNLRVVEAVDLLRKTKQRMTVTRAFEQVGQAFDIGPSVVQNIYYRSAEGKARRGKLTVKLQNVPHRACFVPADARTFKDDAEARAAGYVRVDDPEYLKRWAEELEQRIFIKRRTLL